MRIAHLLPGTGSYHCGTCGRDRALLQALRERGHTVTVVPMYLPSFPPEPGDGAPVQMGALNLYLQHRLPAWRWLPRWTRALLDSPRLLRWLSRRGGNTDPSNLGALTVAMLHGEAGPFAAAIAQLRGWLSTQAPFDVITLSNVLLAGLARPLRGTGARVVCTLQGEAPFVDALPEPHRGRAWALLAERCREIDAFVAVSRHYGAVMQERLQLAAARVHVVHNGLGPHGLATDAPTPSPVPTLGYLARWCDDKGLPLLVEAFVLLRARPEHGRLRLRVAGVRRSEDAPLVAQLQVRLAQAGLQDAVDWLPDLDEAAKPGFLRSLSVFSVPAAASEAFGLYVLEAMAQSVPVVQPRHAAFAEILAHGGGVLCEPGSAAALADGIAGLLRDPEQARAIGRQGRAAVCAHFTAARMAEQVEAIYSAASPTPAARPEAR